MKTTIKINRTFDDSGNLKAIASANFDDCFAVTGIRILDSQKGLFVSMPNRKVGENEYKDICFPVTKEFREELNNVIMDAYHQKLEELQEHENKNEQKQTGRSSQSKGSVQEQNAAGTPEEAQDIASEDIEEAGEIEESAGMSMGM